MMNTFIKIIITMIIDILKGLFVKGPIIKPVPNPTPTVDMNKTIIMSQEELQKQIDNVPTKPIDPPVVVIVEDKPKIEEPIMLVTEKQFLEIFPHGNVSIVASINNILTARGINTQERVAAFLAQCGHESVGFTRLVENLNYQGAALYKIFKSHFKDAAEAMTFAHKQEAIANRVYANRLGNGDEKSGDGWKFRGHGALQTTGRDEYEEFAKFCGKTLEETLIYITTNEGAIDSAAYYWISNNCNAPADKKDMVKLTVIINGRAKLGLAERTANFNKAYPLIAENFPKVA